MLRPTRSVSTVTLALALSSQVVTAQPGNTRPLGQDPAATGNVVLSLSPQDRALLANGEISSAAHRQPAGQYLPYVQPTRDGGGVAGISLSF
jgi:hypothetical protein